MKPLHPALFVSHLLLLILFAVATPALSQQDKAAGNILVERVGDTAFIQLRAPSFQALTPRQQALAYWLTQASIAIDPIIYDQLSASGLRQKRLLEGIMAFPKGIDPAAMAKIAEFAKLFWANRGNHNEMTSQKFLPAFTFEQLEKAALIAQLNGAFRTAYADLPPLKKPADVLREPRRFTNASDGPADLVIDPLFGAPAAGALRTLRHYGRLVQLGSAAAETSPIDSSTIRSRCLRLLGYTNNELTASQRADALNTVLSYAGAGQISVDFESVSLDGISQAWDRQARGEAPVRIVVTS